MCINCSTVCGIIAHLREGRAVKIEGNPRDPNSRGHICAKGHAALNMLYDPGRILFPLRRAGRRGEGKWQRIGWDEALAEVAARLRALRESGHPERLVLQYGRDRTNGLLERFCDAFGTPNKVGHRGLCSLNKRMAIKAAIGDTDWDTNDVAHTRYVLNFGSNLYEAHQGHVPFLQRLVEARIRNGAKLVTFDVRLSNTAARSDEWFPVFPGTDGLVALAMGNVIMQEGLCDREFLDTWTNFPSRQLEDYLRRFSPEWAEAESGVPAESIRRIAVEFARAAPRCTTISNRGAHAHLNGFYNEWAILLLDAIVGSVGKPGGWCYVAGKLDPDLTPEPLPRPPKPAVRTELSHPSAFPLANLLYPQAVSSTIYPYIQNGKAPVDTLITYYVNAPMSWPEGPTRVQEIYRDERLIPFHVAIDAFYSESAHLADLILPDATFLEKWDLDTRNSYELRPYVGLRQPVVPPQGESRDIREILRDVALRVGGGMERYFQYESAEAYVRAWASRLPLAWEEFRERGVWWDPAAEPEYEPYKRPLSDAELAGAVTDPVTGLVTRADADGRPRPIGLSVNGRVCRGFATPSRRLQIYNPLIERLNAESGTQHPVLPDYLPIPGHRHLEPHQFVLTTFKWNVHTQSRTMNQKWLAEIVHDNPVWINVATAAALGIADGDWVEITAVPGALQAEQPPPGPALPASLRVRAYLTEGIHPRVVAISASLGHWQYGPVATGKPGDRLHGAGHDPRLRDPDQEAHQWWAGAGYNPNPLIPSVADPVGGGQAWNDTVVSVRPISSERKGERSTQ